MSKKLKYLYQALLKNKAITSKEDILKKLEDKKEEILKNK